MKRNAVYRILVAILAIALFAVGGCSFLEPTTAPQKDGLTIKVLDVGQGDAILVRSKEKTILIDTSDIDEREQLVRQLQKENVKKIDALMITHPHADHIGGFAEVAKRCDIGQIYDSGKTTTTAVYKDYLKTVKKKNIPFHVVKQGETLDFGDGVRFEVLGPPKLKGDDDNLNNASIVGRLVYGDFAMMFTGDTESAAEKAIVKKYGKQMKSDVLKASHHGSKTSSSNVFLKAVTPKTVLISVGAGNDYGHPHQNIMKRYQKQGYDIYRTDRDGTITVHSDGRSYTVKKETAK